METNKVVRGNSKVILTQQTCGQPTSRVFVSWFAKDATAGTSCFLFLFPKSFWKNPSLARYIQTVRKIAPIHLYLNTLPNLESKTASSWHGKAQTAERKHVVKANRQNWYTHKTIDFLTLLNTEQIQHYDNQDTARKLHLWHHFMQNPKAPQGKFFENNWYFTQLCFQSSCRFAGMHQGLQLKIPRTQCDWIN